MKEANFDYDEIPSFVGRSVPNVATVENFAADFNVSDLYFGRIYYNFDPDKNVIPEPASLLLFGAGMAGILVTKRRRGRKGVTPIYK